MKLLRLQVPLLYLASILLAAAMQCTPAMAVEAAAHDMHRPAAHEGAGHAHSAPAGKAAPAACASGETTCLCDGADEAGFPLSLKLRDLPAPHAVIQTQWQMPEGLADISSLAHADPPERHGLRKQAYADAFRRTGRLLI